MEVESFGNKGLLNLHKTAFLCSRTVSSSAVMRCYDWAMQLDIEKTVVVSGFQSKIEKDVLQLLNKRKASIIFVIARKMYKEIPDEFQPFLADNRLLVISTSSATRNAKVTVNRRNEYIADFSDIIIYGYISRNSHLVEIYSKFDYKSTVLLR